MKEFQIVGLFKPLSPGADDLFMERLDELVEEFRILTQRCNAGDATADEYDRWCELRRVLRACDLSARRMKERRFLRTPIDLPVVLQCGSEKREARCLECSAGGMKLALRGGVPAIGARVGLEFRFPGDDEVWRVRGTVVWIDARRLRCGVQFQGLSDDQIDELRAVVLAEHLLRQRLGTKNSA